MIMSKTKLHLKRHNQFYSDVRFAGPKVGLACSVSLATRHYSSISSSRTLRPARMFFLAVSMRRKKRGSFSNR
jgi:hypothetical protein